MIRNEKQYKISKKLLSEIAEKIRNIKAEDDYNIKRRLVAESLEDFKEDIEKDIRAYENLKSAKSTVLKERSLSNLPEMIIEYKIANHLTHKEFAKILGLKEQQLQRYEAESFKTVSFQNLLKFLSLIDLDLKIKETVLKPIHRNTVTA